MNDIDDIITKFSCFLVQKVSSYGSLVLRTKTISFIFANHKEKDIVFDYKSISHIGVETRFGDAITNFEITVNDQSYSFAGIHEVKMLSDLITLRQQQLTEPKVSIGFIQQDKNKVQWRELKNPTLLYSCMIPATLDQVKEQILNKTFFNEVYSDAGSLNVNLEEWTEKNGFKERTIFYNKILNLPIFGKKLLHLNELQKFFDWPNKFGIAVVSDLGNTPFAECFDPQVNLYFEEKNGKVEFLCKLDVVWVKSTAIKSIIQNQTMTSIKEFYTGLGKKLLKMFGSAEEEEEEKEDEMQKYEDQFSKTRKIYKIIIISLFVILFLVSNIKYRNKREMNLLFHFLIKSIVFIIFLLLLVFF